MSVCFVCNISCDSAKSESVVKCVGSCGRCVHFNCVKDEIEGRKTRASRDWKCKDCRNTSSSISSANSTSSELTKDFLIRVMEQFKNDVFCELKSFKTEITELSTSMQFMSDKIDASNVLMEAIKTELDQIKQENNNLRAHNKNLTSEVRDLKERLRNLEQYTRKNNVEISGIPVTAQENVLDIVKDVGAALGVEIQENQVSAAHRIPSYKKDRNTSLIVQFHSRTTRDSLLSKFRENKTLSAHQVNNAFSQQRVYVNEHLSPENKLFLAKLKQKCRDVGYTYVWCREGKFFIKKGPGDKSKKISSYEEMDKIK